MHFSKKTKTRAPGWLGVPLDQPAALHVLCYTGHASHHCREVIRRGAGRGRCANARRCAVVFSVIAATCVTHSRPSGPPQESLGCRRRLITLFCTLGSGDTKYHDFHSQAKNQSLYIECTCDAVDAIVFRSPNREIALNDAAASINASV